MRLLAAAAFLLVTGCAAAPAGPVRAERVEVVWTKAEDIQRVCEGLSGRKEFLSILGCSRWSEDRGRCEIYAAAPRSERDVERFATLGHELMHCFEGSWHDRWGRMHAPVANR